MVKFIDINQSAPFKPLREHNVRAGDAFIRSDLKSIIVIGANGQRVIQSSLVVNGSFHISDNWAYFDSNYAKVDLNIGWMYSK